MHCPLPRLQYTCVPQILGDKRSLPEASRGRYGRFCMERVRLGRGAWGPPPSIDGSEAPSPSVSLSHSPSLRLHSPVSTDSTGGCSGSNCPFTPDRLSLQSPMSPAGSSFNINPAVAAVITGAPGLAVLIARRTMPGDGGLCPGAIHGPRQATQGRRDLWTRGWKASSSSTSNGSSSRQCSNSRQALHGSMSQL